MSTTSSNTSESKVLISQGAEARLYKIKCLGKDAVLKERFAKKYRHPELEKKLTKSRFTQEMRCCARAMKAGVRTPTLLNVDEIKFLLVMEFIEGQPLREVFEDEKVDVDDKVKFCIELGKMLAKLHNASIAHGDLTTSNVLLESSSKELVLIDFGLARSNANVEDKAVDMYVLERAFTSTHPGTEDLFAKLYEAYSNNLNPKDKAKVVAKFKQVQQRGRKREQIG